MDTKTFNQALDTMPDSVSTVFFGGMGEPLIHKDILYMVECAAGKGVRVELLTNGTLLTREMSAALLGAGLSMLWVSLDSVEAETYEKIRQKSSFAVVRSNIRGFNAERRKQESSTEWTVGMKTASLGIAFIAMKSNIHQLGKLNLFAFENNVSEINVSNVSPTDWESQNESLCQRVISLGLGAEGSGHPRINLPVMDNRIEAVKNGMMNLLGTDHNFAFIGGETVARRRRYCKFVSEGAAFVRHDGEVSPCLALLHSGVTYLSGKKRVVWHHSFGNVSEQSLRDIWDREDYTDFRRKVRDFEFSPCVVCGGCDFREENLADCFGNHKPTCGGCLWSEGVLSCP